MIKSRQEQRHLKTQSHKKNSNKYKIIVDKGCKEEDEEIQNSVY